VAVGAGGGVCGEGGGGARLLYVESAPKCWWGLPENAVIRRHRCGLGVGAVANQIQEFTCGAIIQNKIGDDTGVECSQ